ncbi:Phosphodiesterase YaeI [Frankliniella fusca]|uniref:Phosphodiesterase YaeI n=1 Tax=Frankliniella fusca TaxID=407009 RepID=A0AAE1HRG1_9NEOP|nr:Phosphodiesterase YaeI [Frankliniella fusca]
MSPWLLRLTSDKTATQFGVNYKAGEWLLMVRHDLDIVKGNASFILLTVRADLHIYPNEVALVPVDPGEININPGAHHQPSGVA